MNLSAKAKSIITKHKTTIMNISKLLRPIVIICLIVMNYSCDQISKNMAREQLPEYHEVEVIGDNLILIKAENKGAMLGAGQNLPTIAKTIILHVFPTLMLIGLFFFTMFYTQLNKGLILGFSFIIGGGLGNIIDRITYGSVTDFVHMDFGIVRTGIFNMADVSIMLGVLIVFAVASLGKSSL